MNARALKGLINIVCSDLDHAGLPGGSTVIFNSHHVADDDEWFKNHPRRTHRIRLAVPLDGYNSDFIVIRQIRPGCRLRAPLWNYQTYPPMSEVSDAYIDEPSNKKKANELDQLISNLFDAVCGSAHFNAVNLSALHQRTTVQSNQSSRPMQ